MPERPLTDHPQVPLAALPGVMVDAGVRPLVEFCNRGGWRTVYSCQGTPGPTPARAVRAYVMFAAAEALAGVTAALADRVLAAGDEALAARVLGTATGPAGPVAGRWAAPAGPRAWDYEVGWHLNPEWAPEAARVLTATIRLDAADLGAVCRLLEPPRLRPRPVR